MTEVYCARIRLRPEKTPQVVTFLNSLKTRTEEVQQVLVNEGIIVESLFLERTAEFDFLVFSIRAENLANATDYAQTSTHPFAQASRQFIQET